MNWFKRMFTKPKWAMVKQFHTSVQYESASVTVVYGLYESDRADRRIEVMTSRKLYNVYDGWEYNTDVYLTSIYHWHKGNRKDPNIPTYSQLAEEDVANALKGEITL